MLIGFSFFTVVIGEDVLAVVPISWLKKKIYVLFHLNYVSIWTSLLNMMLLNIMNLSNHVALKLILPMMNLNYDAVALSAGS